MCSSLFSQRYILCKTTLYQSSRLWIHNDDGSSKSGVMFAHRDFFWGFCLFVLFSSFVVVFVVVVVVAQCMSLEIHIFVTDGKMKNRLLCFVQLLASVCPRNCVWFVCFGLFSVCRFCRMKGVSLFCFPFCSCCCCSCVFCFILTQHSVFRVKDSRRTRKRHRRRMFLVI